VAAACQSRSAGYSPTPRQAKFNPKAIYSNRPPEWDLGPVWDPDAEKLRKITRDELYARGRTLIEIADRMNKALAGRELFPDHPFDDERWWFMIWQASGASGA